MRPATGSDIPLLVGLMDEFYREGGYELDQTAAATAFANVIADQRLGYVWIIQADRE